MSSYKVPPSWLLINILMPGDTQLFLTRISNIKQGVGKARTGLSTTTKAQLANAPLKARTTQSLK